METPGTDPITGTSRLLATATVFRVLTDNVGRAKKKKKSVSPCVVIVTPCDISRAQPFHDESRKHSSFIHCNKQQHKNGKKGHVTHSNSALMHFFSPRWVHLAYPADSFPPSVPPLTLAPPPTHPSTHPPNQLVEFLQDEEGESKEDCILHERSERIEGLENVIDKLGNRVPCPCPPVTRRACEGAKLASQKKIRF